MRARASRAAPARCQARQRCRRAEQGGRARGAAAAFSQRDLARILGVSEATASRCSPANTSCRPTRAKEWELARLLVRLFRSLDALWGHEEAAQLARERQPRARGAARSTSCRPSKDSFVSSTTWTPRAVASNAAPLRHALWRAVEAQHVVSTMALVDTLEEQHVLERLLDEHEACGSRGGGAPALAAVHAVPLSAAAGRVALSRAERPGRVLRRRRNPHRLRRARLLALAAPARIRRHCTRCRRKPQTVFQVKFAAAAVDLRANAVRARSATLDRSDDYCAMPGASAGRRARRGVGAIRYESVRDPQHAACCAVLSPARSRAPIPLEQQTWMLSVSRERVVWQRTHALACRRARVRRGRWTAADPDGRASARSAAPTTSRRGARCRRSPRRAGRTRPTRSGSPSTRPSTRWGSRAGASTCCATTASRRQGRPRRTDHLSRPRAARRLSAFRPEATQARRARRWSGRIEAAVIEWLDSLGIPAFGKPAAPGVYTVRVRDRGQDRRPRIARGPWLHVSRPRGEHRHGSGPLRRHRPLRLPRARGDATRRSRRREDRRRRRR